MEMIFSNILSHASENQNLLLSHANADFISTYFRSVVSSSNLLIKINLHHDAVFKSTHIQCMALRGTQFPGYYPIKQPQYPFISQRREPNMD